MINFNLVKNRVIKDYNIARNKYIYKSLKLIVYRPSLYNYFKPIYSPRPYIGSSNNFVKEGNCSIYKISRVA